MPSTIKTRTDGKTSMIDLNKRDDKTGIPTGLLRGHPDCEITTAAIRTTPNTQSSATKANIKSADAANAANLAKKTPPKLGGAAPKTPSEVPQPKVAKGNDGVHSKKAADDNKAAAKAVGLDTSKKVLPKSAVGRGTNKDAAPKAPVEKKAPAQPKGINLEPRGEVRAVRAGTKTAKLIDMLARKSGAKMDELTKTLTAMGGKPWDEKAVKAGFGWDVRNAGYGTMTVFDKGGTPTYFLVLPKGLDAPLAHKVPEPPKAPEKKAAAPAAKGLKAPAAKGKVAPAAKGGAKGK